MFIISAAFSDYVNRSRDFTFNAGQSEFSLDVMIIDDGVLEPTESFTVRAELLSTDASGVSIDPEQSTVTITDVDSKNIWFCAL